MIPTCKKIYLCNQSLEPLCVLNGLRTQTVDLHVRIKDYSTLSFEVDKYINIDGKLILSNGYDELNVYMYIYLEDVGYFKMQHPSIINDGNNEIKTINSNSIEQEFEDKDWINFKCNTGETDSLEQLATDNLNDLGFAKEFVKFYNPKNKELSLLHIILTKMPGWTINDEDIDPLLWNTKLSFNESNINLYALLTSRIAPKADCIFVFNILNRTIKAIHKNNLDDFDTNIFIGYRNLAQEIDINVDEDSVYTSFNCSGADDLNIDDWNYNSSTLYNFDYFLSSPRLSTELIAKIKTWQKWRDDNREKFANLSKQRADKNDKIYVLKYKVPDDSVDWKQWDNMEEDLLLKNQKYYQALLTSLQVSVDDDPQYTKDEQGNNKDYIPWKNPDGTINHELYLEKLYNLENGYGGYYTYLEIINYVLPNIQTAIDNLGVVTDQKKEYVKEYETNWELYGIEELKTKQKDYENKLASLKQFAVAWDMLSDTDKARYPGGETEYNTLGRSEYVKYQNYLGSETAPGSLLFQLKKLNDELSELNAELGIIDNQRLALVEQAQITHSSYGFTNKDLVTVSRLQRHTDYQNSNILSTSVDTTVTRIDKEKELYDDCIEKLSEVSQPQFSFSARIDNFLRIPEFKDWEKDFKLLKFIRLGIRDDYSVKLRLVGYQWNPCEITEDLTLEFSNMITSKNGRSDLTNLLTNESYRGSKNSYSIGIGNSDSDKEYLTTLLQLMVSNNLFKSSVSNIASNTTAPIDSAQINNLVSEYIKATKIDVSQIYGDEAHFEKMFTDYLSADFIATKLISADSGTFTELSSKIINSGKANIEELVSKSIQAENIYVDKIVGSDGEFTNFFVNHLNVNDVFGNNAEFNNIIAANISASQLSTDVANILTLVNGNLTSDNIHSLTLNSKNTTIENGMIKNAMIESLAFDKITGIDVNTTKLTVHSEDGKSTWTDNTIQISDVNRVRVQMGKDASGDYTLAVWDASGNLIWDALGATENTIQRKIIRNDVVADDAAISGSKLDIESVVKEVNGATTKLKSTTILLDDKNQTLDVVFNEMENTVSENSETLTTHTTNISTIQGQISSLIAEDTTIKGDYNALVSKYNSTVSEVDSIKTTIGEHTTMLDSQSDKILSVQTKTNTIESDLSGTKQTISSIQSDMESTTNRVTTVETGLDGLKTRVSNAESTITKKADGTTVDNLTNRVATCETTLDGFETSLTAVTKKVSNNEEAISSHNTRIAATEKSISLKVSTSDFESYKTTVNGEITSAKNRLSTAESSITALNGQIALKVEQTDIDAAVKKVDDKFANYSTTTQMNTAINQKADSITQSVSATYATKSSLETANSNITSLTSRVRTAESKLTKDGLTTIVGDYYTTATVVDSKIDGIQVGGRNLLILSDLEIGGLNSINIDDTKKYRIKTKSLIEVTGGKVYAITPYSAGDFVGIRCGIHTLTSDGTGVADSGWIQLTFGSTYFYKMPDSAKYCRIVFSFSKTSTTVSTGGTECTETISLNDALSYKIKLEKGNKATDWTPAPEDVDSSISAVKTIATQTSEKFNWLVKSGTSSTDFTLTDRTASLVANAINLQGLVTFDGLSSSAKSSIVDSVQVGGRNLWLKTKEYDASDYTGWVDNNDANRLQTTAPYTTVNGFGVQRIASAWLDISQRVPIEPNTVYTLSAWIKWESSASSMTFYTNAGSMNGTGISSQVGTNDYKRVSVTFNSGDGTISTCRFECDTDTPYLIYGLKLEKGNKATDWTPAPEDVDSSISAVDTALSNLCYDSNKTYINGGKIYTGTIAAAQIASNAITTDKLAANAVTAAKIAAGTITATQISSNAITSDKIASSAITADKIASNAVTAAKIAAKAVTADKLSVTSLSAISANLGSVTAGSINIGSGKFVVTSAGALTATGATITGTVTATAGTIGGCTISNGVLQIKKANIAEKLTASQIDVNNLFAQSITATGTITGAKLSGATGSFSGEITAKIGNIGGFTIGSSALHNNTTALAGAAHSVYLGTDGISCGTTFKVTKAGAVIATSGIVGGFTLSSTELTNADNKSGIHFRYSGSTPAYNDIYIGGSNHNILVSAYDSLNKAKYETIIGGDNPYAIEIKPSYLTADSGFVADKSLFIDNYGIYKESGETIEFRNDLAFPNAGRVGTRDNPTGNHIIKNDRGIYFKTTDGSDYRGIGMSSADQLLIGMTSNASVSALLGCSIVPSSNDSFNLGSTSSVFNYVYTSTMRIGLNTYSEAKAVIDTKWKDGNAHNILTRGTDGLTSAIGWVGSASYATVLKLNSRTVQVVNSSGTSTLSDGRLKKDFRNLDAWEQFYLDLEPIAYKYKDGSSGRNHMGFVAQQVEDALLSNGLTTNDFAGLVKYDVNPDDEDSWHGYKTEYGLIYTEFTALNTYMTQKTIRHQEEQDKTISLINSKTQSEINNLKSQLESTQYQLQQAFNLIAEQNKLLKELQGTM